MNKRLTADQVSQYGRDGFHFPVRILSLEESGSGRARDGRAGRGRDAAALAAHREAVERSAKALNSGTGRTAFRA